jgi:hypothetical protein
MKAVAYPPSQSPALDELTGEFLDSYMGDERGRRISRRYLPSREAIVEILEAVQSSKRCSTSCIRAISAAAI